MSIKLKKALVTVLSIFLILTAVVSAVVLNRKTVSAENTVSNSIDVYNSDQYEENMVRPFWKSNVIYNEIVMPYSHQNTDGTIGSGQLLYTPIKIISVRDQTLGIEYAEGKDWVVDSISRKLYFPYGSAITCIDRGADKISNKDSVYPLTGGKYNYIGTFENVMGKPWVLSDYWSLGDATYTEGTMFLDHYLSVTYVYDTTELPEAGWQNQPFQAYNPPNTAWFTKLINKLQNAKSLGITEINYLGIGDSISAGCSATGGSFGGIAPNTPRYQELVCQEIERIYGVKVNYYSIAVGGTTSDYPLLNSGVKVINGTDFGGGKPAFDEALAARDYDICSIGYGMNDIGNNGVSTYRTNVAAILNKVKTDSPDCAVFLINSYPRNPDVTISMEQEGTLDKNYYDALEQIRGYAHPTDNSTAEIKTDGSGNPIWGAYADGSVRVINMHAMGDYMMKFQYTQSKAGSISYNTYTGGAKSYLEISSTNINHPNDFMHRLYAMNIMACLYDYPMETYTYPEDNEATYVHHTGTKEFTFARDVNGWSNVIQDASLGSFEENNGRFVYYDKADGNYIIRNTLGYAGPGENYFHTSGNNTYFHLIWGGHMVNYTPFDVTKDIVISYNYTPDNSANDTYTCNAWYDIALFGSLREAFIAGTDSWKLEYNPKLCLQGSNCDKDTGNTDRSYINGRLRSEISGEISEKFVPDEMNINNWSSYWYTLRISIGTTDTKVYINDTLFATVAKTRADYANGVAYLSVSTGGNMAFNFSVHQDYNISYDLDGGSLTTENPTTYGFNSENITLNNPTKPGYNFAGWTGTGLSTPTKNVTILNGSTGDRAYKATWVEKEITYTDITIQQIYTHNDLTSVAGPALEVYFTGISANMLEQYSNHLSTMDILYERGGVSKPIADFTYISETGAFVMRLGTSLGQGFVNDYYYMELGDTITFKAGSYVTTDGYDRFRIASDIKFEIVNASADVKTGCAPYAVRHTVNFDSNGGPSVPSVRVTENTPVAQPTVVRTGYYLEGWYLDGVKYEFTMPITQEITLTANWAYNQSEITVNNINVYDTILRPGWDRPTLEFWFYGIEFGNWAAWNDYSATMNIVYTRGNEVKELVGFYYATNPFLTYLGNAETYDPQVDDVITIKAGSYIWDGSTRFTISQDTSFKIVTGYNSDAQKNTFLAQSYVPNFTVSFNTDGGSDVTAQTVQQNQTASTPTAPTKAGYTFNGWTLNGEAYDFTTKVTGDITLTATWTTVDYSITYDLDNGSINGTNPNSYTIESDSITLINPTKEGYTFTGWTGTGLSEKTMEVTIPSGLTGDRNYVATWSVNPKTLTATYSDSSIVSGNKINPQAISITLTYYDNTTEQVRADLVEYWYGGSKIQDPQNYIFDISMVGTIDIIVKYSGLETQMRVTITAKEYGITYDLAGGEVSGTNKETYTEITDTFTLINPTKEGYTFAGWTGTGLEEPTMEVIIASGSTGDRIYTATWTAITHNISYVLDGGEVDGTNPTTYTIESEAITLINPTKTGYTFKGWTGTGLEGPTMEVIIAKGSMGNRTYTATWEINKYTVTFNADNGTENDTEEVEYKTAVTKPEDPTKTGYTFKGWYNGNTAYNFATKVIEDITLTAKWEINKYTVTFNADNGTVNDPEEVENKTAVTKPEDPTKTGYTFKGWTLNGEAYDFTTKVTTDITLVAKWEINKFTVSFDLNGASGSIASQEIEYGNKATEPTAPTRDGFTFNCWVVEGENTAYNFDNLVIKDITLKAKWTENAAVTYTVTFETNGGTSVNAQTVVEGESALVPTTPIKTGYTFKAWQFNGSNYDFSSSVTQDITLTATWEINKYTVTFNADNGTANDTEEVEYKTAVTKPDDPTKTGYTFKGWTLNGEAYDFTTKVTGDITLTAKWEVETYTISYTLNGGSAENENSYTIESNDITLIEPVREGYDFAGWTGTDLTEATKVVTIASGSTGDRTYTATWVARKYTVTFNADNGTTNATEQVDYDTAVSKPNDPIKTGYIFIGWYLDNEEYNFSTAVKGNVMLIAKWVAEVTVTFDNGLGQTSVKIASGEKVDRPTDPTKEGYTFDGWYLDGLEFDFNTLVTTDIILTAKWTENNDGGDQGGDVTPPPAGGDNNGGDNAPDTTPDTTPEEQPDEAPSDQKELGCKGSVSGMLFGAITAMVAGAAIVILKRRKNNG